MWVEHKASQPSPAKAAFPKEVKTRATATALLARGGQSVLTDSSVRFFGAVELRFGKK
jgi:hypothetical protein